MCLILLIPDVFPVVEMRFCRKTTTKNNMFSVFKVPIRQNFDITYKKPNRIIFFKNYIICCFIINGFLFKCFKKFKKKIAF